MRRRLGLAVGLSLLAPGARAAPPAVPPLVAVGKPVTTADVLAFIGSGVRFGAGGLSFEFDKESFGGLTTTGQDAGVASCACHGGTGKWAFAAGTLKLGCQLDCSSPGPRADGGQVGASGEPLPLELRVLAASRDRLVLSSPGLRWVVDGCDGARGPRSCRVTAAKLFAEVMPGATDRGLYTQARRALGQATGLEATWLEGPAASRPRVVSQVFFTEGHQPGAEAVAQALAPVLGEVVAQPWPGPWDTDVVVVVGERRETSAEVARAARVEARVFSIVSEQLGVARSDIKSTYRFVEDLGGDSLDHVELVMAIEEEFSLEVPDDDAEHLCAVQDVVNYVVTNLSRKAATPPAAH